MSKCSSDGVHAEGYSCSGVCAWEEQEQESTWIRPSSERIDFISVIDSDDILGERM
ncbi:hypothetical protein L227DRAFT_571030 [Lentinus tigrinus ALCF2SS1-6]|uniref:Uncharacterized protein n=1 Tax=Lentinus tigrinus ALCF2SS1-6 TaxID=1328759 RepID=A0A5C2SMM0_9APHY|nr:hypothetical protein L227DRAFT_571030 [Lentinus tigrinus ALCF2SS1-6]